MSATAFVIGSLLGVALQGAFDRGTIASATTASATTTRHLADAAASTTAIAASDPGVADNNMSDAARLATYCDHN